MIYQALIISYASGSRGLRYISGNDAEAVSTISDLASNLRQRRDVVAVETFECEAAKIEELRNLLAQEEA